MIIRFHSEARKEFFEASEFYEEQVIGLGDEFKVKTSVLENQNIKSWA